MMTWKNFVIIVVAAVLSTMAGGCRTLGTEVADAQFRRGEYYQAQHTYRKIYNKLTKRSDRQRRSEVAARLATCYMKLNQPARASLMLRNAMRNSSDPSLHLMLAQSLQQEGKYADALKSYHTYISAGGNRDECAAGIAGCRLALADSTTTRYRVSRAKTLNMGRSDYSPAFAGRDFDRIYFTSTNRYTTGAPASDITGQKNGDIWMSDRNERGEWTRPEPAEGNINTPHDEGTPSFTPDGRTMYFTRARREAGEDTALEIWVSHRSDARWGEPEPLVIAETDSLYSYAHPSVSPDGRWLYFTSDMPGGCGGYDLWRINLHHPDRPVNLGDRINTATDEVFPFVRDDSTLYFSSDGHPGLGGLDIFKASANSTGDWIVTNMLSPLNSSADDFGITFTSGENGFFSSGRDDAHGYDHIYEFSLPALRTSLAGYVIDTDEYPVPEATIRIVGDDGTDRRTRARDDGSFELPLARGVRYAILATAGGFLNASQEFTSDTTDEDAVYEVIFTLAPVNRPMVVENIFYDYNKATLRPESRCALDSLATVMRENPTITVELSAHTDRVGSDSYNIPLSERRARAVMDYLVKESGIDPRRLSSAGHGKSRPKTITPRLARQFPQFQQGVTLTPEFIEALENESDRNTADQINRRTEFEITSVDFY